MRVLKVGMRGQDVQEWQRFLNRVSGTAALGGVRLSAVSENGIFGRDTVRATVAFQQRFHLEPDGIVGSATFKKAGGLGFGKDAATAARAEVPAPPPPAPVSPAAGNTRAESFARLRGEAWVSSASLRSSVNGAGAVFQTLAGGYGDYVYDEYAVIVERMPDGVTPESFLVEMASDLNGTVKDPQFDGINVFKRRRKGAPTVGEIVDIDIKGPDNGSVMTVLLERNYFVFAVVDTPSSATGSHPEYGAREFGFEMVGSHVRFYTRGVSRPANILYGYFGEGPQQTGWTRLMMGISSSIARRGGKPKPASFSQHKEKRAN